MELIPGRFYFVKDEFFQRINDPALMTNYDTTKRPHYLAFSDSSTSLFWLVPCSSKIEKYEGLIKKRQEQNKPHDHIQIVRIQGGKTALIFNGMFPINPDYISSMFMRFGEPVSITDPKIKESLEKTANRIVMLLRRGIKFTQSQPDIGKIEKMMLAETEDGTV